MARFASYGRYSPMQITIKLQIDEQLLDRVQAIAASRHRAVQELLIEMLKSLDNAEIGEITPSEQPEYDPISPLIGSLHLDTYDLAENQNHDHYLGQALYGEMRGDE